MRGRKKNSSRKRDDTPFRFDPNKPLGRKGFYIHFSPDSEVDRALDQWFDWAMARGINVSGFNKTVWYEKVTGRSAATGELLVPVMPVAVQETQERRPIVTRDPKALRLLGMETE